MTPPVVAAGDAVEAATAALARPGGVIVVPTDTVYGIGASAADGEATARVFACKGRDADVPLAVLCADPDQAFALVDPGAAGLERARALAAAHWPGPLTMVLPRHPDLTWSLGEPATTIGLRCPDHELVAALARAVGPLAVTSANRHGAPTPAEAADAARSLVAPVDLVVDGGRLEGSASTVVDGTGPELVVLRQGPVALDGA